MRHISVLESAIDPQWGGRPRPRRTPWSGYAKPQETEADEGVGRGPGGPPHMTYSELLDTKESLMKKASKGMRPEYDFSGGVRRKYSASFCKQTNVVVLEPDVAKFFPNSAAVNDALRVLVKIAKRSQKREL